MTAPRFGPAEEKAAQPRVVIVSNRLPVTVHLDDAMVPRLVPSSGGLATGLRGVHARSDSEWVGWSGVVRVGDRASPAVARRVERCLAELGATGVPLDAREVAAFYERYANGTLWPVLHDRPDPAPAAPADWETYLRVNLRFAEVVGRRLRPGDQVWVHDYHLMLVPRLLRARHPHARIGFFLHTPFPSAAALASLPRPQRGALLDGLLGADLVGFHTTEYAERFLDAVQGELGRPVRGGVVEGGARAVRVGAFPMGIDAAAFAVRGGDPRVAAESARLRAQGTPLLVGVDRLDYTKGIPERLEAFERLLESAPELRGRARLLQVAVPSREQVPAYRALRERVEALVARVNGRFGRDGWTPVEYLYGCVDAERLSALYRAADVMLVTPLRDGMNLVAKEFVASRVDGDGVLLLSEHAGAAAELRAALLVDPADPERLTEAYRVALSMMGAERRVRMRRLRAAVHGRDVFRWASDFLGALGSALGSALGGALGGAATEPVGGARVG